MIVEFCIAESTQPFISGVWGNACLPTLKEVEQALCEWYEENPQHKWVSAVTLKATWEPDQRDHEGRTEVEGYWDFSVIAVEGFGRMAA